MKQKNMKESKYFNISKKIVSLILITILIIPQLGCGTKNESHNPGISMSNFVLDTICTITIYSLDNSGGRYVDLTEDNLEQHINMILQNAFSQLKNYEGMFSSTIEDSTVYKINHAEGKPVKVEEDVITVLKTAIQYAELSDGLFDVSCGTETQLWDFRGNVESTEPVVPKDTEIAEAVKHVDYTKIKIDEAEKTVQLLDKDMQLDLGGIAKGYIAGRMGIFLEDLHVKSAVIDLGGNILLVNGKAPDVLSDVEHNGLEFPDFSIGVKDPSSQEGGILGSLSLSGMTLVTSGTYERCFTVDDVTYHHILDPKTGYPIDTDVTQVTIVATRKLSTDADALSTICLQMGVEKGMEFIKSIDGVEAIFLDTEGKLHYTSKEVKLKK